MSEAETKFAQRLEMLLHELPDENLTEQLFMLAIQMKDGDVTQRQAAETFAAAYAVWDDKKRLGDQTSRLQALRDAMDVICGIDDEPSPLYSTVLQPRPDVKKDAGFIAAACRAAASMSTVHTHRVTELEKQQAEMQKELDQLLAEEEGDDGESETRARLEGESTP